MRKEVRILAALVCLVTLLCWAEAQPPTRGKKDKATDYSNSSIVTRMMAFNKTKDGKLTKDQVTDARLHRLFDMADANKDGVVTRDELLALAAKLDREDGASGPGGFKGKGPGGFKGKGPKGKGFGGEFGPPQRPGQVLSPFVQNSLKLTDDQRKQLGELQKEVDTRLRTILTGEQQKQLQEMRPRGPGGKRPPPPQPE